MKRGLLVGLLLALVVGAIVIAKAERAVLGAQAYLYGYPLVVMDVTRASAAQAVGPENHLLRVRAFPTAGFKGVVRPNADTLYTTAFIDAAQGPWVLEIAANTQRYELMPLMDAWTNVFATPGTRTFGGDGGRFMLVGPGWAGAVPPGLTLLRAPTQIVWLLGRTQTNGPGDYPLVHRLQDGVTLRSLTDWQAGRQQVAPHWQATVPPPVPPAQQMRAISTHDFFHRLAALLVNNPPAAADAPMLDKLRRLGIEPGRAPAWSLLDRWAVSLGRTIVDWKVARALQQPRDLVRGWSTPPATLGRYGTDYTTRAAVAMVGLGANLPADAMYPNARIDASGQPLNGSHRYRLHFRAGEWPPVQAFWSVTAYGADDFFIDNPLSRYALGDRDPLVANPDGSLDLLVQASAPAGAQLANWLPVRAGEPFLLNARLYWPRPAALNGHWGMPAVERLD